MLDDLSAILSQLLASGLAHCHSVIVTNDAMLGSLFLAGLLGSSTHCVGMCGPFVLAQVVSRLEAQPAATMSEFHRLSGAALVPYHAGRITTYCALGVAAGFVAGNLGALAGLRTVTTALLIVAALLFLSFGLRGRVPFAAGVPGHWARLLPFDAAGGLRWLFRRPIGSRGYLLGLALGFLPCGLLYGALAAAASTGDPVGGGLAMVAFGAGTVPALIVVGVAGHVAGQRWRSLALRLAQPLMVFNAAILSYLAWQMNA